MRLTIAALSFLAVATYAQQTLFVPGQYSTIQAAINAAAPFDTVEIAPGLYSEALVINGKTLVLRGAMPLARPILSHPNPTSNSFALTINAAVVSPQSIVVEDLEFQGPGGGIYASNYEVTVRNCDFVGCVTGNSGACVSSYGGNNGQSLTIEDCVFRGNYTPNSYLVFAFIENATQPKLISMRRTNFLDNLCMFSIAHMIAGTNISTEVSDCEFRSNTTWNDSLLSFASSNSPNGSVLRRTRFIDNSAGSYAIEREAATAPFLVEDIVVAETLCPNGCLTTQAPTTIRRSTFVASSTLAAHVATLGAFTVQNSLFVGSVLATANPMTAFNSAFSLPPLALYTGSNNIVGDPKLADPASLDAHLSHASPCRDAGDPNATNLPLTDFDGTPRVVGTAIDIGCDEIPAQALPGSGEDLDIYVRVNEQGDPLASSATASPGDVVHVLVRTPGGTFTGTTFLLAADVGPTGYPPYFDPFFPSVHLYPTQAFVLAGATNTGAFSSPGLPPQGMDLFYQIPPGLGGYTIRLQGFAITAFSVNGIFACSNARDVEF